MTGGGWDGAGEGRMEGRRRDRRRAGRGYREYMGGRWVSMMWFQNPEKKKNKQTTNKRKQEATNWTDFTKTTRAETQQKSGGGKRKNRNDIKRPLKKTA